MCQTRIYLFVSLFLKKSIRPGFLLVSCKLELGICLIIPDVLLKFSPAFQETEEAFERCSTKVFVQQNDVMKYSSSAPVVKRRKTLPANLLKIVLRQR